MLRINSMRVGQGRKESRVVWGGWGAILAGVAWAASAIVHFVLVYPDSGAGAVGSLSAYLIEAAHALAEIGMLGALLGLHTLQSPAYGRLGKAGFALAFLGTALICLITIVVVFTMDMIGETLLTVVFSSSALSWFLGFPLLGIATLRARVLPRWQGVLLLAFFPLFLFTLSSYGWGGLAFALFWLVLGYGLFSQTGLLDHSSTADAML